MAGLNPWLRRWGVATVLALLGLRAAAVFLDADPASPVGRPMAPPDAAHWLGTDPLGRDVLLRVVESSEALISPGLIACLVATVLALPAGSVLGFWPRSLLSRLLRPTLWLIASWPRLVVVIVAVAIFSATASDPAALAEARLDIVAAILGLTFLPAFAYGLAERVQRFQREEFVESARAHGLSDRRILLHHILWANCRRFVAREWASLFGAWVLVETSLSYLGDYGVPPPRPSWGNILSGVRSQVIAVRSLLRPEEGASTLDSITRAVAEGGLIQVLAPTLLIVLSIGGLQALARSLEEG